jgi:hypothetical protein
MWQTILAMQAMKLLASSGVMAAAGAMISLTFAVSPPLTLVPPRQTAVDVNDNVIPHQTVGAATTDTFGGGTESTDDVPPVPVQPREGFDGLSGDAQVLPLRQEAAQVTPRHDLLEGLIGGLLFVPDAPMKLVEQREPAAASQPEPEQQGPVTAMAQVPPARPSDVCVRHGLRRVYYNQNNHRYWRCAGRR